MLSVYLGEMIRDVVCDVPCRVLEGTNWKLILENSSKTIFFTDEENAFIHTEDSNGMPH